MIENAENILQIVVLLACVVAALLKAAANRSRAWTLLGFFYGSWALGDLYWLACLLFYDRTPGVPVVSDLSWYASFIFLYMLLRETATPKLQERKKNLLPWLGPAFAVGMAVFFIQWGQILSNLIYASLMGLLLFAVLLRLSHRQQYGKGQFLSAVILVFCLLEYALWTASCIWEGDTLLNPYYWFDFLLTVSFAFFFPATERAVAL